MTDSNNTLTQYVRNQKLRSKTRRKPDEKPVQVYCSPKFYFYNSLLSYLITYFQRKTDPVFCCLFFIWVFIVCFGFLLKDFGHLHILATDNMQQSFPNNNAERCLIWMVEVT